MQSNEGYYVPGQSPVDVRMLASGISTTFTSLPTSHPSIRPPNYFYKSASTCLKLWSLRPEIT